MQELIVFTHVPKTSGISFMKTVVEPNISISKIYNYGDIKRFILNIHNDYNFVSGHVPYGLHYFTNKKIKYITFFRNPIERAVSYYYFIKDSDVNYYKHPLRDYADSVSLKQFYENKKFQNMQTRFMAGFLSDRLYPFISYIGQENAILGQATNNLKNHYCCFGLLEKFEKSITIFQKKFCWEKTVNVAFQKKTRKRPKVSDIDEQTIQSLRKNNSLDLQLYNFAVKHFNEQ